MLGAWAFRVPALLWRGKRPNRAKMKMGQGGHPPLVALGWTFTVSGHRGTHKLYPDGLVPQKAAWPFRVLS